MEDVVNPINFTAIWTTAIGVGGTAFVAVISPLVQLWLLKKRLRGEAQSEHRKNAAEAYTALSKAVYLPLGTQNNDVSALTVFVGKISDSQRDTSPWIDDETDKCLVTVIHACNKVVSGGVNITKLHKELGKFQTHIRNKLKELHSKKAIGPGRKYGQK